MTGTREALIEAGRGLFAESGFDGASIRAITSAAGANLGAVTYHFGTKEAFYDAVIDSTVQGLADKVIVAAQGPGTGIDRVAGVVHAHFSHLAAHPEIPRLLLQGVVSSGMPPRAALRHLRRVMEALAELIRAGQSDGTIRAGDPFLMGIALLSQSIHLAVMREPIRVMAGIDLGDDATQGRLTEHVVGFARAAVARTGAGGPP
ncbi:MAG: TetR/AcrR family transcriptional regulator [Gemmatimonadetes bacterium]|nr:TetR/AcrR family transcriptional regulator [Gemmatimonadota bacterium]